MVLFSFLISLTFFTLLQLKLVQLHYGLIFVLLFVSLGLGILRTDTFDTPVRTQELDNQLDQTVTLSGQIIDEPQSDGVRQRFTLQTNGIRIRAFADIYPELQYGDKVTIEGDLTLPENFEGEGGREFNYVRYLEKNRIGYQMFYPTFVLEERGGGNVLRRTLFHIKGWFVDSLTGIMPDPHASLMSGITVGADEGLGEDLEGEFRTTGIIHIVVLSGYNVTIIADILIKLLVFLPLLARSFFAGGSIILFALLVGAGATIVRASIMALIVLMARVIRRPHAISRALILAAVVMLIHNPFILLYDPSFQLSFLATIGLIYVNPLIEPYLSFIPSRFALREAISSTLSTQIFVFPAILYMMGTLSIIAPVVNALVLPVIPLAMAVGFITSVLTGIGNVVALPLALFGSFLSEYVFRVVHFFAHIPGSSITIQNFPLLLTLSIYILYGWGIYVLNKKKKDSLRP